MFTHPPTKAVILLASPVPWVKDVSINTKELAAALAHEAESYSEDHEVQVRIGDRYFTVKEAFLTGADASNPTSTGLAFVLELEEDPA